MIYFNCKEKLSAPPLKRYFLKPVYRIRKEYLQFIPANFDLSFYRFVLDDEVKFNTNGRVKKPLAFFQNMPRASILTMNIHSPESWMVEAVRSPYDLDNILLKDINDDIAFGEYELEHLVIEGHAYDILTGQSPRGNWIKISSNCFFFWKLNCTKNLDYIKLK